VKATGNTADDIRAHCQTVPDRNAVVAALLTRLVPAFDGFPRHGLTPHLENWHEFDALHGQEVRVENAGEITRGMARGIDAHGALLVETPGGVQRFISGEVTVRIDT
jgi:BirA family biotin operon repressor/biotin-[acetyl-CoA-carboxylase] ligase